MTCKLWNNFYFFFENSICITRYLETKNDYPNHMNKIKEFIIFSNAIFSMCDQNSWKRILYYFFIRIFSFPFRIFFKIFLFPHKKKFQIQFEFLLIPKILYHISFFEFAYSLNFLFCVSTLDKCVFVSWNF